MRQEIGHGVYLWSSDLHRGFPSLKIQSIDVVGFQLVPSPLGLLLDLHFHVSKIFPNIHLFIILSPVTRSFPSLGISSSRY
jgi:hypothetical protein